jgi:serine-type D-Ala-D-Ala carboxypeptidase/endopeptidase (penicillin-binding protein 4)
MFKYFFIFFFILTNSCFGQKWQEPLNNIVALFCNEEVMNHGVFALTIIDLDNDTIVYNKNSDLGMSPASTQKIITAICANEILGDDFRFKTMFSLKKVCNRQGVLYVDANYDPTLGSWRYSNFLMDSLQKKISAYNINSVKVVTNRKNYLAGNEISDAWINEDLGNYFGASCEPLMWNENQYDMVFDLKNKIKGKIKNTNPNWITELIKIENLVTITSSKIGDNTCIYKYPNSKKAIVKGDIGVELENLTISGSIEGGPYFAHFINKKLNSNDIKDHFDGYNFIGKGSDLIYTHYSPPLDSIIYWFLKKSINLYGEALLRTFAVKNYGTSDYEKGIDCVHQICKKINIDSTAVHIFDGCGLSPQNRVTTKALATFMAYAHKQKYYSSFYNSLPVINDISMKSGSIHGVRAYTGYINSSDNHNYAFAIIVNNYNGNAKDIQQKLWKILDVIK